MFSVTLNKGFRITFANGWTASVQWGAGNYCQNYGDRRRPGWSYDGPVPASNDAEVWAWKGEGEPSEETYGDVRGYLSADGVLAYLNEVASL